MTEAIVGRESELARIEALLERGTKGPRVVLIEGGPGMGKTTLWSAAIERAREETAEKLEKEDFSGAMRSLGKLRRPLDAFFEHVTVNSDADLRLNRLRLLAEARRVMMGVADFEKITGDGEGVA